jgi:hypothetical protein
VLPFARLRCAPLWGRCVLGSVSHPARTEPTSPPSRSRRPPASRIRASRALRAEGGGRSCPASVSPPKFAAPDARSTASTFSRSGRDTGHCEKAGPALAEESPPRAWERAGNAWPWPIVCGHSCAPPRSFWRCSLGRLCGPSAAWLLGVLRGSSRAKMPSAWHVSTTELENAAPNRFKQGSVRLSLC